MSAVVYLISDHQVVQNLIPSPDEVGAIFDVPLEYCLTAVWPGDMSQLSSKGSEDWPYEEDFYVSAIRSEVWRWRLEILMSGHEQARTDTSWLLDGEYEYRMNRLRTTGTPLVSEIFFAHPEVSFSCSSSTVCTLDRKVSQAMC